MSPIPAFHGAAIIDRFRGTCLSLHATPAEAELAMSRIAGAAEGFEIAPVVVTVERMPAPDAHPAQLKFL